MDLGLIGLRCCMVKGAGGGRVDCINQCMEVYLVRTHIFQGSEEDIELLKNAFFLTSYCTNMLATSFGTIRYRHQAPQPFTT